MVSFNAGDHAVLHALAEAQWPPLPLQCLVRRAIRRFLHQSEGTLLKPARDAFR